MSDGRYRVLLIAEAANPEWTSVPLVGWSLARALMDLADALLVTQVRNREAILRTGLIEGQDFVCIDTEHIAKPRLAFAQWAGANSGKGWTISTALSNIDYYEFERLIWKALGPRITAREFDVVHRITPLTPVTPSLLAKWCAKAGVPFVVGPMNGGVPWPKGFGNAQRKEREWLAHVRNLYRLLPGYRGMRMHARALLIGSLDTLKLEPSWVQQKCIYLPENAISPERFSMRAAQEPYGPLRVCFVGRLVPYKGADMLIESLMPHLEAGLAVVDVVGDGPDMVELNARYGQTSGVTFHGWMAHGSVQSILSRAHVFGFPSIREFGGGAVLEAMALGVVPVVADYGGPAELVTPETGYKVSVKSRTQMVADMSVLFDGLTRPEHRAEIKAKSIAASERVARYFTWEKKASQVLQVYQWMVTPSGSPAPVLIPDVTGAARAVKRG
jgi:glycosyltransferase involved in cell wall biosynthesis